MRKTAGTAGRSVVAWHPRGKWAVGLWLLATGLLVSGMVRAETLCVLDDFEDGCDIGWQVAGHSEYVAAYVKRLISPGMDSTYCLRLTRETDQGWCGLCLNDIDRRQLRDIAELSLEARSLAVAQAIIADVYDQEGGRWQCRVALDPGGPWESIALRADAFSPVAGTKLPHPDLAKLTTLIVIVDGGAGSIIEIDDVAVVAAGEVPRNSASTWVGPEDKDKHTAVRVGIVQTDQLPLCGQDPSFPPRAAAAIANAVDRVIPVAPGTLARWTEDLDVLLWDGPAVATHDLEPLHRFLTSGKALYLSAAAPPLSRQMDQDADGRWHEVEPRLPSWSKRLLCFADSGMTGLPLQPTRVAEGIFRASDTARDIFPGLPATMTAGKCVVLPTEDSTRRCVPPPWVRVTDLLSCRYGIRNWINQNDTVTGLAVALFEHRAGPFAGARVFYNGLAAAPQSPFCPRSPGFDTGLRAIVARLARPADRQSVQTSIPLRDVPPPSRETYFSSTGPILTPIAFGGPAITSPDYWEDMRTVGFNVVHTNVLWLKEANANGEVIDWERLDEIVAAAEEKGYGVIIDPYSFFWSSLTWTGPQSIHNGIFLERFTGAMVALAKRYAERSCVIGLFATPHTGICSFTVDDSEFGQQAWRTACESRLSLPEAHTRYGLELTRWEDLPLPQEDPAQKYNVGPLWHDYLAFHWAAYQGFLRTVIRAIRDVTPTMPIFLRGPYLDVAVNMALAAEFEGVSPHIECMETTTDTEGYFRSLGLRFGVPISGENGWPKLPPGPARMAIADLLMGGYRDLHYSFAGPSWAVSSASDIHDLIRVWPEVKAAAYARMGLALLIPDTTLYVSRPANFFAMEGRPHLQYAMERLGFPFEGISAQFPRLEGLRVIIDDGTNEVLTPECMAALTAWIAHGGTLVGFEQTGRVAADGGTSLAQVLGLDALHPGVTTLGQGSIRILPSFPDEDELEAVLTALSVARDVRVSPRVSNATFHRDGKHVLVLYNKQRNHVGAFFTESRLQPTEASLPDLDVEVRPTFTFSRATDLRSGKNLHIAQGVVSVNLKATEWAVIRFE